MSWPNNVLVAIDQFFNTIACGNPDATISARVGYFSDKRRKTPFRWYWKSLELVLNFTFYPIEGPDHCKKSYYADKDEKFKKGSDFAKCILGLFVIVGCVAIAIVLRVAIYVIPAWRWEKGKKKKRVR